MAIINTKAFSAMRNTLNTREKKREQVIQGSRQLIQLSKQTIYAVHRNDLQRAQVLGKQMAKHLAKIPRGAYETGMRNVAEQEYTEAMCFYTFIKKQQLPSPEQLDVSVVNYLAGVCDLTGELTRRAVNAVVKGNPKEALRIKDVVEEIHGEFLKIDLVRNSELRKKSDQIKWSLKKLEELAYDLHKRGKV